MDEFPLIAAARDRILDVRRAQHPILVEQPAAHAASKLLAP